MLAAVGLQPGRLNYYIGFSLLVKAFPVLFQKFSPDFRHSRLRPRKGAVPPLPFSLSGCMMVPGNNILSHHFSLRKCLHMPDQPHLDALLSQVIRQARAAGIPVSSRIAPQVRVNGRAKTRLGCCRTSSRGHVIEISAALCGGTDSAIRQVLAHEVLHTCPGCSNHGAQWKLWAERMNQAYGYRIQRTDSPQALGIQDNRPVRYLILCSRCGAQIPRMKRSPLVEHPERYRCKCGGSLQVLTRPPE